MDGHLKLATLGEFTIELNGEPVGGLVSRKADALLAHLAVTRRPHAREHLATLLWDDRPLDRSLANLSVVLNSLKKQLAPFLQIDRKTIAINPDSEISVDLLQLLDAIDAWDPQAERESTDRTDEVRIVDEALSAYEGDFLQGFHLREARGFDEWASMERERIQRVVQTSLRQLSEAYRQQGNLIAANSCLHRALAIDLLQEGLHRELMRNLALSGQQGASLAQYRKCAAVLKAELDVEPALATRRLYDRILARRERPLDNLPSLATTTIGRQDEVKEIHNRLREPNTRLLTLVGVGGIGKTRLALEVAVSLHDAFFEGLWFVDLAPVEDPELVPQAIGRVLAMPDGPLAADMPPQEGMISKLLDFLETKDLLLILDNCEHLLDACVPITERLLRHCPGLKILVTSRERFDLPEEHLFIVEPLIIPEDQTSLEYDIDSLRENESIRLFEERAQAVRKPFALNERNADILVRICRTLDGMPLAIELTASRLRSLSLTQIAENLEESVQSYGRDHQGAVPRHQTLEAAIDWSYHLLNEEEQRLFRQATIFRSGFDLPALIEVSQALGFDPGLTEAILAQLVEKSLVVVRDVNQNLRRYALLEPVRQFGFKRMQVDPLFERALDAHAEYYLQLAEAVGPELHGRQRKINIRTLELDADNLRAALRRHLKCERSEVGLRFAHALWEGYWLNLGYFTEGRDWVDQVLKISDESMGFLYGSTRLARGAFEWTLGSVDKALDHVLQALEHGERIGEARLIQWALYWKAIVIFDRSDFTIAAEVLTQAYRVAQEAGETRGAAWAVFYQAQIARVKGQTERAIVLYKEALAVLSELDIFGAGWCFIYLGHLANEQQNLDMAREYLSKSLDIFDDLNNPRGLGGTERGLGLVELEAGDLEKADMHLRRSRHLFEQLGWIKMSSSSMIYLGLIATLTGRVEEASDLLIESLTYEDRQGDWHSIAHLLFVFGLLAIHRGKEQVGLELFLSAEEIQQELEVSFPRHLVVAVEQARSGITPSITDAVHRQAAELTPLILANHRDWLTELGNAIQDRS